LSAVIDINWVCRGLFCVATTRNVGQDLATFGDVGDMSATRRLRLISLALRLASCSFNIINQVTTVITRVIVLRYGVTAGVINRCG